MTEHRKWCTRIDPQILDSVKFRCLCRMLSKGQNEVLGMLARLWNATLALNPDGILTGWSDDDVAEYSGWEGEESTTWINALMKCGQNTSSGNGYLIKDGKWYVVWEWNEWQNNPVETREKGRKRFREWYASHERLKKGDYTQCKQIETPQDQTVARFLMLAQRLKMPNTLTHLRTWIEGRILQGHMQKMEEVLSNGGNAGHSTIILDKLYFNGTMEKHQRDFQREAIEAAKKEVESQ